jgi:hypothetical protein
MTATLKAITSHRCTPKPSSRARHRIACTTKVSARTIRIGFPHHRIAEALKDVPRDDWGTQENNGFDFVRIMFPNVSAFIAPEITQVAQLFPGPTPGENRTVLNYLRREPIRDEEDRANVEAAMNFFRDVTYHRRLRDRP